MTMFVTSKVSDIFYPLCLRYVRCNDEVGEIQNMLWQCGLDVSRKLPKYA